MNDISRYESYSILKNSDFSDFYDFCQSKKNCDATTDELIEKLYDLIKNRIMQVRGEGILVGLGTKEIKDGISKDLLQKVKEDEEENHQQPTRLIYAQNMNFYDNRLLVNRLDSGAVEILITNNRFFKEFIVNDSEALKQIASLMYGAAIEIEDGIEQDDKN